MYKRISALIWLRAQIILSNKSILLQILLAFAMTYLYKYLGKLDNSGVNVNQGMGFLIICLSFSLALAVGNPISTIISEEKEKNNLRTLLLGGVKNYEYVISTLFFPILLLIFVILITPLILGVKMGSLELEYIILTSLTGVAVILLYLFLGLSAKNQISAQITSLFAMLLIAFLPLFSSIDKNVAKISDYTFMGLLSKFFTQENNFSWNKNIMTIVSLAIWILALMVLNFLIVRQSKMKN